MPGPPSDRDDTAIEGGPTTPCKTRCGSADEGRTLPPIEPCGPPGLIPGAGPPIPGLCFGPCPPPIVNCMWCAFGGPPTPVGFGPQLAGPPPRAPCPPTLLRPWDGVMWGLLFPLPGAPPLPGGPALPLGGPLGPPVRPGRRNPVGMVGTAIPEEVGRGPAGEADADPGPCGLGPTLGLPRPAAPRETGPNTPEPRGPPTVGPRKPTGPGAGATACPPPWACPAPPNLPVVANPAAACA